MKINLLGVDVGWSTVRASSGLAWLAGDQVETRRSRAGSAMEAEVRGKRWDLVAIDAPLVPVGFEIEARRRCETALSLGEFQRRCKPGMSDVRGTGRELRAAGSREADRLEQLLSPRTLGVKFPHVRPGANLVEAFPNAFLGVCVPDETFVSRPAIARGGKFDWLYDRWVDAGTFEAIARPLGLPERFSEVAGRCRDHDERAALVCLLTAAAVGAGKFTAVGDGEGGYFFLPPLDCWEPWALAAIEVAQRRVRGLEIETGNG